MTYRDTVRTLTLTTALAGLTALPLSPRKRFPKIPVLPQAPEQV